MPIFKTGDAALIKNYIPISILTVFLKEQYILTKYIVKQYFVKLPVWIFLFYFTYMVLTIPINKTTSAMDKREHIIGLILDFAKAFDTVNHDILLKKLNHYGIRGIVLQWFQSYLSGRQQSKI